jgi:hypothetical protein
VTTYIYGVNQAQFDAYRSIRTGPARNVTFIADSTTLAAATGSGHTIAYLCAYHARPDSTVIEAQIEQMVSGGRATVRQDPVGTSAR